MRLMAADFTLVGLNWLFVGAASLFSRTMEPLASSSLLGIALLHAALITLLGYSEGLYARGHDLRQQARGLGKATLWATGLLYVSFQMQGAPPSIGGVVCSAGLFVLWALCC